jgi:hypothetical protein
MKFVGAFTDKDSGLNGAIVTVAETIKKVAEPVFEGFVAAFGFIKAAIDRNKDSFESFAEVVKAIAPVLGTVLGGVVKVIGSVASVVLDLIGKVAGAIAPILNAAITGINAVIRGLNLIRSGEDIPQIPKIGAAVGTPGFSGTTPGGQSFAGSLVVPKIDTSGIVTGSTITGGSTAGGATGGGGGGGGGGVSTAAAVAATAAAVTSNIVTGSFNAGSFRAAESASMTPTINLTVNGAIDSEGTARTIINTLNDSFYRGTGGATSLQTA